MSDFTIEQLEALKEGTTPGPWITHAGSFGRIESVGPIEPGFSGNGLECAEEDADLATAAPDLVDALIAEKRAHQKLRAGVQELRDWYVDRSQYMRNLHTELFYKRLADDAELYGRTADQLTEILEENNE